MTKVNFSEYIFKEYNQPPPRKLNGGLYTGEPFKKDSIHANVPVIPDTGYMIHYNLRSANPPPGAIYQYPGNIRPGNNFQHMIGISKNKKYNIAGNEMACSYGGGNDGSDGGSSKNETCRCVKCRNANNMNKYYYI